ncbi:MAG: hypothetical protein EAZ60_05320 [Oscillatoriales cyanobacterium]|nr:MAG: hypothetical protein EAZ83_25795 [Oscillatoriales cyanobacterium]TAE93974.1 MAG: hypothetical protein EAZ79_25250 [Oscillatoriales cyanobacterium]TAF15460.1 MAG: hypothetical protein EAZ73_26855 [Oscillatoriales cyanobacterium]TAF28703.1 MAG: hypothetical protein EAZ69_26125 [Oscillatoriales cyanobacterium]TAF57995.1 MAG: hypothetical protein EAZ60_05320 [Oscillatoriales cyanobacterium]
MIFEICNWELVRDITVLIDVNNRVKPTVRLGLKPLSNSESPLKRTDEFFSPLQRTFAMSQGLKSLAVFRVKLRPLYPYNRLHN